MAIYVFKMKTFSRNAGSRGSRATSAAAYRAGERIHDERTGAVYDHRRRQDVLHKEIVLPRRLAALGSTPEWARTRSALWNAAERAETRRNSRVAREFTLALPHELEPLARVQLAQRYAHQLSDRYGTAIDLVIHAPRGDSRNFHAHLLSTTREVTPEGLGRKAALELSGTERHRRGLARWSEEKTWLRERWAEHTNQALRAAHLQVRVSHLRPATPDRSRAPWLPIAAYHMEKQGRRSFLAERIRARHHQRVALEELAHASPGQARASERAGLAATFAAAAPAAAGAWRWLVQLRERARTAWLGMREQLRDRPDITAMSPRTNMNTNTFGQQREALREAGEAHSPPSYTAMSTPPVSAFRSRLDDMAHQSVRNWLAYRASHGPGPTAEESVRNWLAYRQRQLGEGMAHERSPGQRLEQAERGPSVPDERQRVRSHGYDLGL